MYNKSTFLKTNSAILATLVISSCLSACGEENIVQAATVNGAPTATENGAPTINNVEGNIATGTSITISGADFTSKTNAQPLFWWHADDGSTPSPLGRKATWDSGTLSNGPINGEISTAVIAPGSKQSVRWDLSDKSDDAALAKLEFESEELYVYRKLYENFDIIKDVAIRSWVDINSISGTQPAVGDFITASSGATGTVNDVYPIPGTDILSIFFDNAIGTGTVAEGSKDFENGETMTVQGTGVTMTNIEPGPSGLGVTRTFNYKPIRAWNYNTPPASSILIAAQGTEGADYRITPEGTDNTIFSPNDFLNPLSQIPEQWITQEIEYRASDIDTSNGRWNFHQNGVPGSNKDIITRTSATPGLYHALFQTQVSNGAQPGSFVYFDSLYVDDTWHRVIICSGDTADKCTDREIQIPTSWSDTAITVQLNLGGLNPNTTQLYLYVVNKHGLPNLNGWSLTP